MATWRDVRRLIAELPDTDEETRKSGTANWRVYGKSFAWERPLGKSDVKALGAAAPSGEILAIRTADEEMKDVLLHANPRAVFTIPHFDGYNAVLILLAKANVTELRALLLEAWLARAPERTATEFLARRKAR